MIYNAKLQRVDVPAPPVGGNVAFTNGSAIDVPCAIDGVKSGQRWQLGSEIKDATAVLYLLREDVPAGLVIENGYRLTAQLDGEAAITYQVEFKNPRVKEELSHYEIFVRAI